MLSIGFRVLVSRHPAIQTTGLLTLAPAGLSPAEHASLRWTHNRTCRFPASGSRTKTSRRLSRATPSAVSEHHVELIGCPISMSFATFCVCLELRSLPSAGVARFPRYYEPLRHPRAPGLSLAGVRLVLSSLTEPRFGASRVARAFLVCVLPPLPRCSGWASSSLISPNRHSLPR